MCYGTAMSLVTDENDKFRNARNRGSNNSQSTPTPQATTPTPQATTPTTPTPTTNTTRQSLNVQ